MAVPQGLQPFLALFFEGLVPSGFIEVRVIGEKGTDSKHRRQHWFDSIEALCASFDALLSESEEHDAAIYFGVLPRVQRRGRAVDVVAGRVVWADLDFNQYERGEAEARELLDHFPIRPSAIVRSGHGLHAYWLMEEGLTASELSTLAKRVELALRSDHVSDKPRIMRLPFTFNRKNKGAVLVELEDFNVDDEYEAAQIEACTPAPPEQQQLGLGGAASTNAAGVTRAQAPIAPKLPDAIAEIIKESRTISELYVGRGRREGDLSTSGYDLAFLLAVIKKGVREPKLLEAALASRPNSRAIEKGARYITRTVAKALEDAPEKKSKVKPASGAKVQRAGDQAPLFQVDFEVEKVVIYDSDPPVYVFTIDGREMTLSTEELLRVARFELRFMQVFNRMTKLPSSKEKAAWRDLVNRWLAGAERVEQPPEASREYSIREAIQDTLEDLQVGDAVTDLDRDRALLTDDGRRAFKLKTMMKALKADFRDVGRHTVTAQLRRMGIEEGRPRFDGKQVRVWLYGEPGENGQADEEHDVPF